MSRYAFLWSRRWLGTAALAIVVAAVCVVLGSWQLQRHEYRAETIERVAANSTEPAVPLSDLIPDPSTPVTDATEWRAVRVSGRYLPTPVLLPQRGVEGAAADHALALFEVAGTQGPWLLVVDRGWFPTDAFTDPGNLLAPPGGQVELELRLRPAEPASDRNPVAGQVFRINPEQVLQAAEPGRDSSTLVTGGYAFLVSENPSTQAAPTPIPIPAPNYRSNLSYALQWWSFALMAFIGFAVMARRERHALDVEAGIARTPRVRRRLSDADIEDAAIDAADAVSTAQEPGSEQSVR
ncbi:MAG: SURF1 family protein [Beutenbergiaceae bacterium]